MTAKNNAYEIKEGKGVPTKAKAEETEWLLRYGSGEEILSNRFYIAHIVKLYIEQFKK